MVRQIAFRFFMVCQSKKYCDTLLLVVAENLFLSQIRIWLSGCECNNRIQLFEDDGDILFFFWKVTKCKIYFRFCLQIQSSHHCSCHCITMGGKQKQISICNKRCLVTQDFYISGRLTSLTNGSSKSGLSLSLPKICSNKFAFCLWHERKRYQKNLVQFPLLYSFLIIFSNSTCQDRYEREREREKTQKLDKKSIFLFFTVTYTKNYRGMMNPAQVAFKFLFHVFDEFFLFIPTFSNVFIRAYLLHQKFSHVCL